MVIFNIMLAQGAGGIENMFLSYTKALTDLGYITYNIIKSNAVIKKSILPANNIITLPALCKYDIFSMLKFAWYLLKYRPDIIISHNARSVSLCSRVAKLLGIKNIFSVCHSYRIKKMVPASKFLCITKHLQSYVASVMPYIITDYVPNTITYDLNYKKNDYRAKSVWHIGSAGRIVNEKDFLTLLKAVLILKGQNIKVKCSIAGDGPCRGQLEDFIKTHQLENDVILAGWQNNVSSFMQSLDIFCLPSIAESFGLVILESFAAKVPVVATDCHGPLEIASHNKNMLICPKSNEHKMAETLLLLINNYSVLAPSLCNNATTTLEEKYSFTVFKRHLQVVLDDAKVPSKNL